MAKSKAKKFRERLEREGRRNPLENRSPFALIDMHTRKTKTKKDYLYRNKHKNQHIQKENVGSFYFNYTKTLTTNNAGNLLTKV
ncbi:hypothetical protein [Chengkuizengella sediminis]|uniref:hypothetical protein n=1 Tax=Chengkuizengella sediminis TaxID=1885917 RepID=UPI001389D668|nr:hypothetical protein [Chengkuizengella sediminis]NDI34265.1 hypothetical protein [Chengkuizengella sediminis]